MQGEQLLNQVYMARSREVFGEGVRTNIKTCPHQIQIVIKHLLKRFDVTEPFLFSSYSGGEILTITTAATIHCLKLEDLSRGDQSIIKSHHNKTATPVIGVIDHSAIDRPPVKNDIAEDGQNKTHSHRFGGFSNN